MDYFTIIPNRVFPRLDVFTWLSTTVGEDNYKWETGIGSRVLYFKFQDDLLAFKLRCGL